jgi:hypothetical protein
MKMEFHHIGIPTKKKRANETYMAGAKLYVTDVADSEHKIEWLRFEEGSPLPKILQTSAHAAFKVDDVAKAMKGKKILLDPFEAGPGITVGFVLEDEAPIEYMSVK